MKMQGYGGMEQALKMGLVTPVLRSVKGEIDGKILEEAFLTIRRMVVAGCDAAYELRS